MKKKTKANSDLLNEAIADAKTIKKIMEEKAKDALFETFNARIKQEMKNVFEGEDIEDNEEEVAVTEEGEEEVEEAPEEEMTEGEEFEEDPEEAPVDDVVPEDDEIDIEEILREIEDELSASEESFDDDETLEDPEIAADEFGDDEIGMDDDEELDIEIEDDEVPGDDEFPMENRRPSKPVMRKESAAETIKRLTMENDEYREIIGTLSANLKEVNLMNTKLNYIQKLAHKYNLSNINPERLLEKFDRAKSVREVKLTYSLLSEAFKSNASAKRVKSKLRESVTRPTTTKKQILKENTDALPFDGPSRIQKLAGIKK